ncbi:MAG: peptidylprolyl isomerase [Acidobacteriota bacterium]
MNKLVCLFSILLGLPAVLGQEAPAATPPSPPAPLAEMNGYQLTDHSFELLLQMIPSVNKQTITPQQKQQIIKNWMQVVTFSKEALAIGLDRDPAVAEQMEMLKTRLLFERYQKDLVSQVKVSEEEARKYFEQNKDQFQTPGQSRVSRILLPTKEKADEVRRELTQGAAFEQLAKERSTDGLSKQQGGDIGWIKPGHPEADLVRVVQALQPNEISGPFSSPIGWQIVKVTEKRPAVQKEFTEVEKTITQQLLVKKQREAVEAKAKELSEKYAVKINEAPK